MELVSIIMPAYNASRYLKESIDSVLAQTYTNWELLIVDDCSTDETAKIVQTYEDKRIRYKRNTTNLGAAKTRNEAIRMATGRYIAFLDSDDRWLPNKLERQIHFMQEHNYAMTYTPYYVITSGDTYRQIHMGPRSLNYYQTTRWDRIGCLTVIYDSQAVGKIYLPTIRNREDYGLWLLILRKGITAYMLEEPLAVYRSHNGISSGSKFALVKYHYEMFRIALGYSAVVSALLTLRNSFYYVLYTLTDNKSLAS